jgi:peptide/nickel transport system ATP-binding protein
MTPPLLEVTDLCVEFPQRRQRLQALDRISFTLEAGEVLGFVGESGAGKSLTGAAIMGLLEPPGQITGGRIALEGQRIDGDVQKVRGCRIGMIFQDPLTSLNPLRTVGDQLVETIQLHLGMDGTAAAARAGELLDEVGIDRDRIGAYPHEFSGGMRQRIVIALALAPEPKLIIADEPTTALDVSIQAQVLALLRSLCKDRGAAVILITHDMGVIAETTDRVAVLYAGRLVETGRTVDVISAPRHPYTRGLMAATPNLDLVSVDTVLPQIPGNMPSLADLPPGCRFHPRCGDAMPVCRQAAASFIDGVACHLYDQPAQEAG